MGFYADSGFGRTLSADPSYTERVNVSPTSDMEFVAEDALPLRGDTPAARVSTGVEHAVADGDRRVQERDAPSPPALSVSPASLAFSGDRGRGEPGGQDADRDQHRRRDDELDGVGERELAEPLARERHERGTITATPSITGLAAGTYTTDVTVTAPGAGGLAQDDPG